MSTRDHVLVNVKIYQNEGITTSQLPFPVTDMPGDLHGFEKEYESRVTSFVKNILNAESAGKAHMVEVSDGRFPSRTARLYHPFDSISSDSGLGTTVLMASNPTNRIKLGTSRFCPVNIQIIHMCDPDQRHFFGNISINNKSHLERISRIATLAGNINLYVPIDNHELPICRSVSIWEGQEDDDLPHKIRNAEVVDIRNVDIDGWNLSNIRMLHLTNTTGSPLPISGHSLILNISEIKYCSLKLSSDCKLHMLNVDGDIQSSIIDASNADVDSVSLYTRNIFNVFLPEGDRAPSFIYISVTRPEGSRTNVLTYAAKDSIRIQNVKLMDIELHAPDIRLCRLIANNVWVSGIHHPLDIRNSSIDMLHVEGHRIGRINNYSESYLVMPDGAIKKNPDAPSIQQGLYGSSEADLADFQIMNILQSITTER